MTLQSENTDKAACGEGVSLFKKLGLWLSCLGVHRLHPAHITQAQPSEADIRSLMARLLLGEKVEAVIRQAWAEGYWKACAILQQQAQKPVAWRREWHGDIPGQWLYTEEESETKDGFEWEPLFQQHRVQGGGAE